MHIYYGSPIKIFNVNFVNHERVYFLTVSCSSLSGQLLISHGRMLVQQVFSQFKTTSMFLVVKISGSNLDWIESQ